MFNSPQPEPTCTPEDAPNRVPKISENERAEFFARQIACQLNLGNWQAAHALIETYRREISRTAGTQRSVWQWLEEPLSSVPGIPIKALNQIEKFFEVLFVGQFLRVVPDLQTLLRAPHLAEGSAIKIGLAFREIGIQWPVHSSARLKFEPSTPTGARRRSNPSASRPNRKMMNAALRAKAQCRHCRRYSRDLEAALAPTFPCDCGRDDGWSSQFSPPRSGAKFCPPHSG